MYLFIQTEIAGIHWKLPWLSITHQRTLINTNQLHPVYKVASVPMNWLIVMMWHTFLKMDLRLIVINTHRQHDLQSVSRTQFSPVTCLKPRRHGVSITIPPTIPPTHNPSRKQLFYISLLVKYLTTHNVQLWGSLQERPGAISRSKTAGRLFLLSFNSNQASLIVDGLPSSSSWIESSFSQ